MYQRWRNNEPGSEDCARVKDSDDHKWEMKSCSSNQIGSTLCMKGTSAIAETTAAPAPAPAPATSSNAGVISNEVSGWWKESNCAVGDKYDSDSHTASLQACCNQCISTRSTTNKVSLKPDDECWCINTGLSSCQSNKYESDKSGYRTVDCTASKRKKRSLTVENIALPQLNYNDNIIKNLQERSKRQAVDTTKQRQFKCEPLWDGEAGYWLYQYETPPYCFRINCTHSDLRSITTDITTNTTINADVEIIGFNPDQLYYQKTYSYKCHQHGKNFKNPTTGLFQSTVTTVCQANKTWSFSSIPLQCECRRKKLMIFYLFLLLRVPLHQSSNT